MRISAPAYHGSLHTNLERSGGFPMHGRRPILPLPLWKTGAVAPFSDGPFAGEGQAKESQQDPRPLLDHVGQREDDNRGDACPTATV